MGIKLQNEGKISFRFLSAFYSLEAVWGFDFKRKMEELKSIKRKLRGSKTCLIDRDQRDPGAGLRKRWCQGGEFQVFQNINIFHVPWGLVGGDEVASA